MNNKLTDYYVNSHVDKTNPKFVNRCSNPPLYHGNKNLPHILCYTTMFLNLRGSLCQIMAETEMLFAAP